MADAIVVAKEEREAQCPALRNTVSGSATPGGMPMPPGSRQEGRMRKWKRAVLKRGIERRKQEIADTLPTKRPPKVADARGWAESQLARIDAQLPVTRATMGAPEDAQAAREAGEQASNLRGFALTEFLIDLPAQSALS